MSSATPEIGEVTSVVLDTDGDLEITEGEPSLTIHAPEGILELLTATVRDGVLELGRRPGAVIGWNADVRYELTVRSLESIELNGSGDVTSTASADGLMIEISGSGDVSVDGLTADTVEVTIDGSGNVELSGATESLSIEIDGSGEVDTENLDAVTATLAIGGSGSASVNATGTLSIDISGSGSVRHTGGAVVDSEISGSGDVHADD